MCQDGVEPNTITYSSLVSPGCRVREYLALMITSVTVAVLVVILLIIIVVITTAMVLKRLFGFSEEGALQGR